jgi:hypothetical protein
MAYPEFGSLLGLITQACDTVSKDLDRSRPLTLEWSNALLRLTTLAISLFQMKWRPEHLPLHISRGGVCTTQRFFQVFSSVTEP